MNNIKKPILITSALPYVNNVPHLGNIIGCVLSADVHSRYLKSIGHDVLYVCGTDEYGTTTEIKAEQEKMTPQEICDKYYNLHKNIYGWFNINFDVFGRTSTSTQTEMTQEIFTELYNNSHIEEKVVNQLYCNNCERFLADRYIKGICYHIECKGKMNKTTGDQCDSCGKLTEVEKIINPQCNICESTPEFRKSDHLFLKLGNFQNKLEMYMNSNLVKLTKNTERITNTYLKKKLHSRCITRDLKWGVKVPIINEKLEKYRNKVFYVWFDAPIGYYSILKHNRDDWEKWLHNDVKLVQFMAKDNVPFHTVMFPATLMGINKQYPIVNTLSSCEYLNYEQGKFSKSNNTGVFGDDAINISNYLGIGEDYWRYYLLKNRPETHDSPFTWVTFIDWCNADLIKNYGNYAKRCISMTTRYLDKQVAMILNFDDFNSYYDEIIGQLDKFDEHMNNIEIRSAINVAFSISGIGNKFLQTYKVWDIFSTYVKNDKKNEDQFEYIQRILWFANWITYISSKCLQSFIPRSTTYIINYMGIDNDFKEFTSYTSLFSECRTTKISFRFLNTKYNMPFKILTEKDVGDALVKYNINSSTLNNHC